MLERMETFRDLLLYCRAGFEGECAQEVSAAAAATQTQAGDGFVTAHLPSTLGAQARRELADWRRPIFARQCLPVFAQLDALPRADRLTPILAALEKRGERYADAWVEAPDSDEGKALAPFCKSFGNALIGALKRADMLDARAPGRSPSAPEAMDGREGSAKATDGRERPVEAMDGRERPPHRLHAFFPQSDKVYLCSADPAAAAPWPQGIPRLKFPREAPSRSTLKLEEALLVLLDAGERERWLKAGMSAVDLGAAPGGWTWQLVRRSMRVTAVDNGPMAASLLQSGLVTHRREDGFRFQPKKPVDWMVCDMVEQPRRVAELVARWLSEGWCRRSIFNLKLPMKKRYDETRLCLDLIRARAGARPIALRARQLYHDREEITVFAG
jgi:23S rRNA (cytidine2498-2'-O)-methyltransferase